MCHIDHSISAETVNVSVLLDAVHGATIISEIVLLRNLWNSSCNITMQLTDT